MNCKNCGTFNNEGFKYCVKCGNSLETNVNENVVNEQPTGVVSTTSVQSQQSTKGDNILLCILKYIISFIIKPFETYKNEEIKLENPKFGLILSGIIATAMMIIKLLISMISAIFVKTLDYSTFEYKTKIEFAGLKELDYLNLIVKNLFIYIGIIVAIAGVYYLASLVMKKSINFIKTLSISASSIIPYVIMGMLVSPILGKIWSPLSVVATIVGVVYSIIIFVLLLSENINFDKKEVTAYFHLVCMTILGTVGYYVYIKIFTSGVVDQIGNYLDMFK